MSISLYDSALLSKLQKWTKDTHISLTSVNETKRLFETIADSKNDKPFELPLITLSRPGGYTILQKYKQPKSYYGAHMLQTSTQGGLLNVIPISISYQIDVYTRYMQEADEYARNLVFNIINYPKLQVEIPYESAGLIHDGNIRLESDIEDNSDIPERLISGQFTRFTIRINIDDAYLFDVRLKDNLSITEVGSAAETSAPEVTTV